LSVLDIVLGKRLATLDERAEQIGTASGIPIFGLDALSSAAYGPEAALTLLIPLGALGISYIVPVSASIIVLLTIVYFSYRQTIAAYPNGGGSYTVAKDNLGQASALLAGAAWTIVLSSLYVSAQIALPAWVRARGLAIFLTVIFGSVTLGSLVWGEIATTEGLSIAHFAAAVGALLAIPLTWRWKLQSAAGIDLSPSMHWRAPILARQLEDENGPVLVTVKYRIAGEDPAPFLSAIEDIGDQRRRDGAYAWGIFEDVAEKGLFLETFLIENWLEARHLRERVTNADRLRENYVRGLIEGAPDITLMIASDLHRRASNRACVAAA